MKYKLIFCPIFCLITLLAHTQNTYLAYEALNNTAGVALNASAGGSGWAAPWDVQNSPMQGYVFSNNSLSFGSLQTFGGCTDGGYQYLTAGRRLDDEDGGAFDAYVTGNNAIGSTIGTTLYISGLLMKANDNASNVFATFHNNNTSWCNSCAGANIVGFGYFGSASDVSGVRYWSLRIGSTVYPSNVPVTAGISAFFVLKLGFGSGGTQVDLHINPSQLGLAGEPAIPTLTQTTSTLIRLRSCALYLGESPNQGAADELRFATTYAVAAPDNTVVLNLPPTGIFSLSPASGTAPLTLNFDATASYDPENQPLTYSWNFGDGSPLQIGGATAAHTYGAGLVGQIPVTLTVRDALGQAHSPQQILTLYAPGTTTFPCQSSVTMLQEADCGQSNGIIRINPGNGQTANILFRNSANLVIAPTSGNQFHNLAPGLYTYSITGTNGCRDSFPLRMTTDSTTCPGWRANPCKLQIGVNVSGIADWSWEHAFNNLYKHVREDVITYHSGSGWDTNMASQLIYDTAGYPIQLPQSTPANTSTLARFILSSAGGNLKPNQQYVLLYDGVGTFTLNGAVVNSNTPGRLEFTVPAISDNIWLNLSASLLGNHLRNFRLLRIADENLDLSTQVFNPYFLSRLSPFSCIRFMDWGHTNDNPLIHWNQRKLPSYRTYAGETGVPYELMIALANLTGKDIWVCVPHAADDNFILQMATLFRDQLNPGIKVYLEYSNEVWNWMFAQAHYNDQTRPAHLNYPRAYAERAKNAFRIWHSVWGAQSSRVLRVLGLQAHYVWLNEQIMSQLSPDEWDMASPTYYFGLDRGSTANPALTASSTANDVNLNARNQFFGQSLNTLRQDYRNIKVWGKRVGSYEGGQHYTQFNVEPYQQAMYDAQYLPSMYSLYNDVLDTIRAYGNELAMAFVLSGVQESVWGSWGHLPDMYLEPPYLASAPKYQALLDNSCLPFVPYPNNPLSNGNLAFVLYGEEGGTALAAWTSKQDNQNSLYELQQLTEGGNYVGIAQVPSQRNPEYRYTHKIVGLSSGRHSFRVRANDLEGKASYSEVESIWIGGSNYAATLVLQPNPTNGMLNFLLHTAELPSDTYELLNQMGQSVLKGQLTSPQGELDLSMLPAGVYYLRMGRINAKIVKE